MRTLLLSTEDNIITYVVLSACAFIISILFIRWVFDIPAIVAALKKQNKQSHIQILFLKKMLISQGIPEKELDEIIEKEG